MTVSDHLDALESNDLIRLALRQPQLEYLFRHALLQDAAYASLLREDRRRLHRSVGETLERLYTGRLDELAALLGHHFDVAGDWPRALKYYTLAGDNAARHYANEEALMHYSHAIEASRRQEGGDDPGELLRARGRVYETTGEFERARSDYETALQLAQQTANRRMEWEVLLDLGALWAGRDYAQTERCFRHAMDLARALNDPAAIAQSLNRFGNWNTNVERPAEAQEYHRQALANFQALQDRPGIARTTDLLAMTSYLASDYTTGSAYYRQAIAMFRELDDRRSLSSSLSTFGSRAKALSHGSAIEVEELLRGVQEGPQQTRQAVQYAHEVGWRAGEAFALVCVSGLDAALGHYSRAFDSAHAGLVLAESIGHRQWMTYGHMTLGILNLDLLAAPQAIRHLEMAREMAGAVGSMFWMRNTAAFLALAYLAHGQAERATDTLDALPAMDAPAGTLAQRNVWHAQAELALARGDARRALALVNALDPPDQAGAAPRRVVLCSLRLRGDALVALGRWLEAEATLRAARDLVRGLGMRPLQWRILASLARACVRQGKHPEGRHAITEACTIARLLAQDAPADLRDPLLRHADTLSAGAD